MAAVSKCRDALAREVDWSGTNSGMTFVQRVRFAWRGAGVGNAGGKTKKEEKYCADGEDFHDDLILTARVFLVLYIMPPSANTLCRSERSRFRFLESGSGISEVRNQKSEIGNQEAESRSQESGNMKQTSESRSQRTGSRRAEQ